MLQHIINNLSLSWDPTVGLIYLFIFVFFSLPSIHLLPHREFAASHLLPNTTPPRPRPAPWTTRAGPASVDISVGSPSGKPRTTPWRIRTFRIEPLSRIAARRSPPWSLEVASPRPRLLKHEPDTLRLIQHQG